MSDIPAPGLLRLLGPTAAHSASAEPPHIGEGPRFAELLEQARQGALETGLPVSVASGAGVELTGAQLERLSKVVDQAHASGATRIVVMMDGLTLDVDVLSRRVLGVAELGGGRTLTGIDGLVRLEPTEVAQTLPPPTIGGLNASLRRALGTTGAGDAA